MKNWIVLVLVIVLISVGCSKVKDEFVVVKCPNQKFPDLTTCIEDAMKQAGSVEVLVARGTYTINSTIKIAEGKSLVGGQEDGGDNMGVLIKTDPNGTVDRAVVHARNPDGLATIDSQGRTVNDGKLEK